MPMTRRKQLIRFLDEQVRLRFVGPTFQACAQSLRTLVGRQGRVCIQRGSFDFLKPAS